MWLVDWKETILTMRLICLLQLFLHWCSSLISLKLYHEIYFVFKFATKITEGFIFVLTYN